MPALEPGRAHATPLDETRLAQQALVGAPVRWPIVNHPV
jgi:hypothetical protein